MQPLLFYAIKVIVCSGILVGYYWLTLRNKVFHQYNRFYLLAAIVLSLLLPVIKIDFWQEEQASIPVIQLLQAVDNNTETMNEIVLTSQTSIFTFEQLLTYVYFAASLVFLFIFLQALIKIFYLYRTSEARTAEGIQLIETEARGTPFSFFRLIFWNLNIDLQSGTGRQILKHEIAHVQQKHSYDKLFINAVLIVLWCNPFFWLIRKELNMIHEFTADKAAVEDSDTGAFAAMILQAAYPQHRFDLTNPFFYSPIKRRLMMLTKNTHNKAGYISRLMVLPLAAIVFVAFTFKTKLNSVNIYNGEKITVVIDAGHGGNDHGATGNGLLEKDIALAITKKIKSLNSNSNIDIILTRETDIYQSPVEKADLINASKAGLAISIHMDGAEDKERELKNGVSFWIAKNQYPNADESKYLASVLIKSFENFPLTIAALPQQREHGVWVLQESKCPIVLVEAGYITNKNDFSFLQTEKGKEAIALNILKGIEQYLTAKNTAVVAAHNTMDTIPTVKVVEVPVESDPNEINTSKALLVMDGKILGKGTNATKTTIEAESMFVKWLKPVEAMAKYGDAARFGACELTTINKKEIPAGKAVAGAAGSSPLSEAKELVVTGYPANGAASGQVKEITVTGYKKVAGQPLATEVKTGDLNEVTVVGYGTKKELLQALELKTTGLPLQKEVEVVGRKKDAAVKVRGTQLNASEVLYVLDGNMLDNANDVNDISPDNIKEINVIKGESALRQYGDKGKNGVIEIRTKNNGITAADHLSELVLVAANNNNNNSNEPNEPIFTKAEQSPAFPGGDEAWKKYLMKNLQADMPVKEGWKPGVYKIIISFIVKIDGTVADVRTNDYPGSKTAEQCISLIKNGPKWQPAVQNGKQVNCYKKQPVTFVVEGFK